MWGSGMQMYKLRLVMTLWKNESKSDYVLLQRNITLPFAPTIGIVIAGDGWESGRLRGIRWDTIEQIFVCHTEDDVPGMYGEGCANFPDHLDWRRKQGWEYAPDKMKKNNLVL